MIKSYSHIFNPIRRVGIHFVASLRIEDNLVDENPHFEGSEFVAFYDDRADDVGQNFWTDERK